VTNFASFNKNVVNTWAATNYGLSTRGYSNNAAVGRLVLDALALGAKFTYKGVGVSNAIYVDELVFLDQATNGINNSYEFSPWLSINTNMMIYFAQATALGSSIAKKIDNASLAGKNGGRLRWVPTYAGYFSSTNVVIGGVTNAFNSAAYPLVDSDGDGIANVSDPTPFFLSSMINPVVIYQTNPPSGPMVISWNSIPFATNFVFYSTNMTGPFTNLLTTFSTNISGPFTMSNFISPIPYPSPAMRVMIFNPVTSPSRYYQPVVSPWLTYPF